MWRKGKPVAQKKRGTAEKRPAPFRQLTRFYPQENGRHLNLKRRTGGKSKAACAAFFIR